MNASSNDSEEERVLGQEELDMSIFGNEDCHLQVIHVGRNEKTANIGKVTQYNRHPYQNYNRYRRWRSPQGTSKHQPTHKVRYREKTQEDLDLRQHKQAQTQIGYAQQTSCNKKVEHSPTSPDLPTRGDQIQTVANQCLKAQVPYLSQEVLEWLQEEEKGIVIQQNGFVRQKSTIQSQPSNSLEDKDDQIQVIELKSDPQKPKRKPKKEMIASLNANEDSEIIEPILDRRTRNWLQNSKEEPENSHFEPFSFVKELEKALDSNFQSLKHSQFCKVEVVIGYKGPIYTLKIKSITVDSYSEKEIKILKSRQSTYKCEQKYSHLIEIKQNIFQARREYDSTFKQAKFQLCKIRLPISTLSEKNIYTKENLAVCPIQVNRISITCFCSRKFETVLSSAGVTCSYCSLPSELALKSITFKQT